MADIVHLGPHDNMTVEECLAVAAREAPDRGWRDVIVLAYDKDDQLVVRSSGMARKDALWLLMDGVDHARMGE